MEQFRDFARYAKGVDPYGMQSGIVLIDPPEEWCVPALHKFLPQGQWPKVVWHKANQD